MPSHGVFRLLDRFSLLYSIEALYKIDQLRKEGSWRFRLGYGGFVTLMYYMITIYYSVYLYLQHGDSTHFIVISELNFRFGSFFLERNSLIVLALITLYQFAVNIVHYSFVKFVTYFEEEHCLFMKIARLIFDNEVTVLDLCGSQERSRRLGIVASKLSLGLINKFANFREKLALLKSLEKIQKTYLFMINGNVSTSTWSMFGLLYYFTINVKVELLSFEYFRFVAEKIFELFQLILTTTLVSFYVHIFQLIILVVLVTWNQFAERFRQIKLTGSDAQFVALYRQLEHGQRLFVQTFSRLHKLNTLGISKVFKSSVMITFVMNIICVIELFIGNFRPEVQLLIIFLIVFQMSMTFAVLFVLLMTSRKLYALNGKILQHQMAFAEHRFEPHFRSYRILSLVRWNNFVEVVHNRWKFAFSFGNLGKITSWNLFKMIPIYTSFIMFIAPFVSQENNIRQL